MAGGAGSQPTGMSNPFGPQQGQGSLATGGMGQMPNFSNNPFGSQYGSQYAQPMGGFGGMGQTPNNMQPFSPPQNQGPGTQNQFGGIGGQQPINTQFLGHILRGGQQGGFDPATVRPAIMQTPSQNPFQPQPQQPAYMQNPEYQGYRTQMDDLNRQMEEYVRKAPMYQQMRDLENKMHGYDLQARMQQQQQMQEQQPMQEQMQRRYLGQPSQFSYQQPMGLQSLLGMLGGMGRRSAPAIAPPQGMEARRGHGGTYFVPRGTPYDPGMG